MIPDFLMVFYLKNTDNALLRIFLLISMVYPFKQTVNVTSDRIKQGRIRRKLILLVYFFYLFRLEKLLNENPLMLLSVQF